MEARDHECDVQGIVNNAHYQHYFEHARHRFLRTNGLDFSVLSLQGINLVVADISIRYVQPLRAHQAFSIDVEIEALSKVRYQFRQTLRCENTLYAQANTTVVVVDADFKPLRNNPLMQHFQQIKNRSH